MAPPAETTSPLRLETPERKRSSRTAQIIETVIKLQEEVALSPGTNKLGDELRNRALANLDGHDSDQEDLDISWRIFERLVKMSKAHAAEMKERSDKLAEVEKELELVKEASSIDKARLQRLQLLLSEGDWAADILNWVRHYESDLAVEEKTKYVIPRIRERGIRGDPVIANDKIKWRIMGGHQVQKSLEIIETEQIKVKKWPDEGSDETKTPLILDVDRIDDACAKAGVLRRDTFNIMSVYAVRNQDCYRNLPVVENFAVKDGNKNSID